MNLKLLYSPLAFRKKKGLVPPSQSCASSIIRNELAHSVRLFQMPIYPWVWWCIRNGTVKNLIIYDISHPYKFQLTKPITIFKAISDPIYSLQSKTPVKITRDHFDFTVSQPRAASPCFLQTMDLRNLKYYFVSKARAVNPKQALPNLYSIDICNYDYECPTSANI